MRWTISIFAATALLWTATVQAEVSTFRDCTSCPEMVVIPPGSFMMGSPSHEKGHKDREGPQHRVRIGYKFAVGKYEITQAEWRAVMGNNPSSFKGDRKPVEQVSWDEAQEFVTRLSRKAKATYRLLTEAEWEYSARAGTTSRYYFGDAISSGQANFNKNNGGTVAVGRYGGNRFGLYDMHGNVWEWVEDCYKDDAYSSHSSYPRAVGNRHDSCDRVLRGGSWIYNPGFLRSADRFWGLRNFHFHNIGFRVARTLNP